MSDREFLSQRERLIRCHNGQDWAKSRLRVGDTKFAERLREAKALLVEAEDISEWIERIPREDRDDQTVNHLRPLLDRVVLLHDSVNIALDERERRESGERLRVSGRRTFAEPGMALERQIYFENAVSRRLVQTRFSGEPKLSAQGILDAKAGVLKSLRFGETFVIVPTIVAVLVEAARSIPGTWNLLQEVLPTQRGFVFLGQTDLVLADGSSVEAFSWEEFAFASELKTHGLTLSFYCWRIDAEEPEDEVLDVKIVNWEIGTPLVDDKDTTNAIDYGLLRFVAAFFQFIQQRILIAPVRNVDRAVRRRLERAGYSREQVIRVIELRRKSASSRAGGDAANVEWTCQWLVRGHWRQQWYPSLNRHQPKWILPYVKGPDHKPFKEPRATVYAVVR